MKHFSIFRLTSKPCELEIPEYRFLAGTWAKSDEDCHLVGATEPHLNDRSIFCNIGIQQIETQLEEIDNPSAHMLSMSADTETGSEFYCWSTELVRINDAVRNKLCQFIEIVIEELKLPSNDR